ncbi:Alpha/Beta hydrolase protein [Lipomyces arxii]|uniref:Alpha/Beta hydrolase protein n=1 Tax=Lipomyces arxii TaxID=56418 RepID=UPI0034CF50AC
MANQTVEKIKVNDLEFYTKTTTPAEGVTIIAKMFFLHGFADHIDRFDDLFKYLAARGIETFAYDQRGAGLTSPEKRNWGMTEEKILYNDMDCMIEKKVGLEVSSNGTFTIPWFLAGHSMGGGITLSYAIKGTHREWFAGYIGLSPLVLVHPKTAPKAYVYYALLGVSKLMPRFQYFTGINYQYLSRDTVEVESIKANPLNHNICTLRQMANMLDRGKRLYDSNYISGTIDRPILVIHGDEDMINHAEASKSYVEKLQVSDKTFVSIQGGYHDLIHDIEKDRILTMQDIYEWIAKRTTIKSESKL